MENGTDDIAFENDRVRVVRIGRDERQAIRDASRGDRLIVYLRDGRIIRTQDGRGEEIARKAGDVVWRSQSAHRIENVGLDHDVLVIEFKPA